MIKELVKDREFLSLPAEEATAEDVQVAEDLKDTMASLGECACLAANQIGSRKAVIAYEDAGRVQVMFNPKIVSSMQRYMAQESCLSLEETNVVERFQIITVAYQVHSGGKLFDRTKKLNGWAAEIVQHGIDHCAGRLI